MTLRNFVTEDRSHTVEETARFAELQKAEVNQVARAQARQMRRLSLEIEIRARLSRLGLHPRPTQRRRGRLVERLATSAPLAALALQLSSCGNGGGGILDPVPPPHVYSTDIEPLLESGCAKSGCHDAVSASADLVLEEGRSYDQLVGVESSQLPEMNRVEPFRPDSSYLLHKLWGTHLEVGGTGEQMPSDADPDPGLGNRVELWIADGAKDDKRRE
jgi:hypothetical protein